MTVGIARNPYASNVADRLLATAARLRVPARAIDLASAGLTIEPDGRRTVADRHGRVAAASLAPYLLFGFPAAVHALRELASRGRAQNRVDSVIQADDKAATALALANARVPQLRTQICAQDPSAAAAAAARTGYPVVVKRTHGAQGRWVRRARDQDELAAALAELAADGPGALVVQPEAGGTAGRSVRVIVTGGRLLAATERTAAPGEWRSNIAGGAAQRRTDLTGEEGNLALDAARALGLGHAGIDILRTGQGPRVLEVNSCPDFTSMQPYYEADLAEAVLRASL